MYIRIVLFVLIVFSLRRESLKRVLVDETDPEGIPSQRHTPKALAAFIPPSVAHGSPDDMGEE
jgi:hypothetical protein